MRQYVHSFDLNRILHLSGEESSSEIHKFMQDLWHCSGSIRSKMFSFGNIAIFTVHFQGIACDKK